jgi:hypothetical protein
MLNSQWAIVNGQWSIVSGQWRILYHKIHHHDKELFQNCIKEFMEE